MTLHTYPHPQPHPLLLCFLLLLLPPLVFSQSRVETQSPTTTVYVESDGSGNAIYVCRARPNDPRNNSNTFSVVLSNLTNIVISSNTATITFPANHGFQPGNKLVVAGSATTALNGTYAVVTGNPASTTLTFTTSGVSNATVTDAVVSTDAPLLTKPVWSIAKNNYSGTNFVSGFTAGGDANAFNYICANRATVNGANVVTYK